MQIWTTEWAAPTQLSESHLTRTSLKPGDKVIVIGAPGRDVEAHRIRVTNVTRPLDGWKWEGVIQ
jgi:thiamine monophosphate kinase